MALIRPRMTEFYGVSGTQSDLDFAIPFFGEDIPLYVDPFLLWRSPSQQDNTLHTGLTNSFNRLSWLIQKGKEDEAIENLILASECDEVGLGVSAKRQGKKIGVGTAKQILSLFVKIRPYGQFGFSHFEEIQLYVDGVSKDRISDISCNFLKSFLIDYTAQQCIKLGIPLQKIVVKSLYDYRTQKFLRDVTVDLPVNPVDNSPIIVVPKRWLRHVPWINFDDYFCTACPKDDLMNTVGSDERVNVLTYNQNNYGVIEDYVRTKELTAEDCKNDPLFKQIPVLSARRKLAEIRKIPTGNVDGADKSYENAVSQLMASLLYPHLDFATTQSRSDGGSTVRDLIFYNNRSNEFLKEIMDNYGSRQLVMELKNVKTIERDHIYQLNRYLTDELGKFGVLLTRNPLSKAMFRNTIELWSGQRRCIVALSDADLELMVQVFDSKQRLPVEVLKKRYVEFRQACPS